jgi:CHAD domain-containing protein
LEGNALPEAERSLCKTRRQLRKLELKTPGWMAIEPGLKQCYQRGQETLGLAVREPTPENFHAWRKQVKTFWYQLQLICPKRSREAQNFINHLEQLGVQLGMKHDLVLLKQFVTGHCAEEADEVLAVEKLIEMNRRKLRQSALKLGGQLFADEPATVCLRLKKHWCDRRGG